MSQQQYLRNLRLINWLAGLNNASFFVPFAVPFWLGEGLTQQKIYLLQSVFTIVMMVLEVPTGVLADRIGRRRTLMLAGGLASCGFALYCFAHGFWQFAVAESLLALGLSMNSGTLDSMRHESALALEGNHGRSSAGSAHAAALLSAALSAALGGVVAKLFGFRTLMVCDALTYVAALVCASRMLEPPRFSTGERAPFRKVRSVVFAMGAAIAFFALLRESTHIPVFLNARVLEGAGIGVGWMGFAFAGLYMTSGTVSTIGERVEARLGEAKTAVLLAVMAVGSYLATGLLPKTLAPLGLIGFAVLFGLSKPFVVHALNSRITNNSWRATVNSCATLVARALYLGAGPLVGAAVDRHGVQYGLTATGLCLAVLMAYPLLRMTRKG